MDGFCTIVVPKHWLMKEIFYNQQNDSDTPKRLANGYMYILTLNMCNVHILVCHFS